MKLTELLPLFKSIDDFKDKIDKIKWNDMKTLQRNIFEREGFGENDIFFYFKDRTKNRNKLEKVLKKQYNDMMVVDPAGQKYPLYGVK